MSKLEIRQRRRIHELEEALAPFARVVIPDEFYNTDFLGDNRGGDVWLYVGRAQESHPGDLHTDDFFMARYLVRTDHK